MSTSSPDPMGSQQRISAATPHEALHGALVGLIPLGLLLVVVFGVLLLAALGRQVVSAAGFFVQQQVSVSILIAGLSATIILYAIAAHRTLRHVAAWQRNSLQVRSRCALWALGFTALVVLLPVLLALLLPQHPAA
jgi:hypothetical protein